MSFASNEALVQSQDWQDLSSTSTATTARAAKNAVIRAILTANNNRRDLSLNMTAAVKHIQKRLTADLDVGVEAYDTLLANEAARQAGLVEGSMAYRLSGSQQIVMTAARDVVRYCI